MEIKSQQQKIKCDVPGCKNKANYVVENKTFFFNNQLNLCEDCVKEIYEWYAKKTTPKSPVNMFNRAGIKKQSIKTNIK